MALDNGDFDGAQQFFQQAADLDPSFAMADSKATEAADLTDASARTAADVAAAGSAELGAARGVPDATAVGNTEGVLQRTSQDINPSPVVAVIDQGRTTVEGAATQASKRDATQEAARTETTTQTTATITIKIARPGGGGRPDQ